MNGRMLAGSPSWPAAVAVGLVMRRKRLPYCLPLIRSEMSSWSRTLRSPIPKCLQWRSEQDAFCSLPHWILICYLGQSQSYAAFSVC